MTKRAKDLRPRKGGIRILPFGGCGQFGMNVTAYITHEGFIIVDAGSKFPMDHQLGVDCVFPNLERFVEKFGKFYGYVITHGHEDHIGSLPFLYQQLKGKIFAPPWSHSLLVGKFEGYNIPLPDIQVVRAGDRKKLGPFGVEWIHLNHSIPDSMGLCLEMDGKRIFHSGDFKIEDEPLYEKPADVARLKVLGQEGVDVLLADSTNAHKEGRCGSEREVVEPIKKEIASSEGLTVVTTFSSNLWRLATMTKIAKDLNKKIFILGRGMRKTCKIAAELKFDCLDKSVFVDQDSVRSVAKKNLIVLTTGCQGERFAGLSRLANGHLREVKLSRGDKVIFSSRMIPGNEAAILDLQNKLEYMGCKSLTTKENPEIHVSGHGYQEDLSIVMEALKPKTFLAIHGTFFHLRSHKELFESIVSKDLPDKIESGDLLEYRDAKFSKVDNFDIEHLFVDSFSGSVMNYGELKERLRIGEKGLALVTGCFRQSNRSWVQEPELELIGVGWPSSMSEEKWFNSMLDGIDSLYSKASKKELSVREGTGVAPIEGSAARHLRMQLQDLLGKKPEVFVRIGII